MSTTTMGANAVINDWLEASRTVAAALISKYEPTDEVTPAQVAWRNRGPWKKVVASNETTPHNFLFPHGDIVENFTEYDVLLDVFSELAHFDESVTVSHARGLDAWTQCSRSARRTPHRT